MKIALVGLAVLATAMFAPWSWGQTDSDMLEKAINGVVTVAVYKTSDYDRPFGFGAADAYEQLLDLSDATETGSGFCIEQNGKKYIVTNCHVIEGASEEAGSIAAFGTTRHKYPMKIVGADSFIDIAVLEFADEQPGDEIRVMQFATDLPRLGEKVFAIGNPYGDYPYAVSDGIIGGLNRVRNGDDLTGKFGYLESTATIIWGNSGGPLVNEAGNVVGVNTGIEIRSRYNQLFIEPQINFALEASVATRAVDDIISVGHVRRAYLGVRFAQDFGAPKSDNDPPFVDIGAKPVIADVLQDGPAAGLAQYRGAVVTKVNDSDVENIEEVLEALESVKPGDTCTLWLDQDGHTSKATVKTDELTQDRAAAWAQHLLADAGWTVRQTDGGVTLQNVTPTVATDSAPTGEAGPSNSAGMADQPPNDQRLKTRIEQFGYGLLHPSFQPVAPPAAAAPAAPPVQALVALGIFDDSGKAVSVWKVSNLSDLGVSVRLDALEGRLDLGVKGQDDKLSVVRIWLSGEEGKLSRSLLY